MTIKDIMAGAVDVIAPKANMREAARRMRDDDTGALPVGENDRLVGMITDRDIAVRGVAGDKDPDKSVVEEIMSEGIYYCYEDDEPHRAAEVMSERQVRRLPVVNRDKRLTGMISLSDLVEAGLADKALAGVAAGTAQERR